MFKSIYTCASTNNVWTADNQESYESFCVSVITGEWKFRSFTIPSSKLKCRHAWREHANFVLDEARAFRIKRKIEVVTNDGTSNDKKKVQISGGDEAVLLDIQYQPSKNELGSELTNVSGDGILCILNGYRPFSDDGDVADAFEDNYISAFINNEMEQLESAYPVFEKHPPNIAFLGKSFDNNESHQTSEPTPEPSDTIAVRATWTQIILLPSFIRTDSNEIWI